MTADALLTHALPGLGAATVAFGATLVAVPFFERVGHAYGLLDRPDTERRLHAGAVPRLGGFGIAVGATLALLSAAAAARSWGTEQPFSWPPLVGLIWGTAIVFAVGVADDLVGMRPWQKLTAQTVAGLVAVGFGAVIDRVAIAGVGSWSLGVLGPPVTLLWLVGVSNAFNLIDGMDGLAGGAGLIAAGAAIVAGTFTGQWTVVLLSGALAGSMLAFMHYNRHPARIFLGDSGSLAVGFALAVLTAEGARDRVGTVELLVPLAALAYPLIDTGVAVARRYLRGHPYSRADGRHVHHQLFKLGLGVRRTVWLLWSFAAVVAAGGLTLAYAPARLALAVAGVLAVVGCVAAVYGLRWLGYDEFVEASDSVASAARKARDVIRFRIQARELSRQLTQAPSLDAVREILSSQAGDLGFDGIEIVHLDQRAHKAGVLPRDPAEGPWCLECPVRAPGSDGRHRTVVLRIWIARQAGGTAVNAERIAARLLPTLEDWMRDRGAPRPLAGDAAAPRRTTPF